MTIIVGFMGGMSILPPQGTLTALPLKSVPQTISLLLWIGMYASRFSPGKGILLQTQHWCITTACGALPQGLQWMIPHWILSQRLQSSILKTKKPFGESKHFWSIIATGGRNMNRDNHMVGCLLTLLLVALSGAMPVVALLLFIGCAASGLIDWK
jgi:hypothetical protein